ncbi:MAG: hypothetical protein V1843_01340 [bacterium]
MISKDILDLLNRSPAKSHSLQELVNFTGAKKAIVKVTLSRLVSQKKIYKIGHGFYSGTLAGADMEQLACQLVYPSYMSFESALNRHGIYDQVPASLTMATARKTKSIVLAGNVIEYSHLKKELFFGYQVSDNIGIAIAEKALLDELYLVGLKKRSSNLREFNLENIDLKKVKKWLPLYPPSTQKLVRSLLF